MSGKLVLLDKMLKNLFANGHKVLIFSQFTMMLDIIEDYFREGWRKRSCRIDGSVKFEERQEQINGFNDPESEKSVFLLSTRAGVSVSTWRRRTRSSSLTLTGIRTWTTRHKIARTYRTEVGRFVSVRY